MDRPDVEEFVTLALRERGGRERVLMYAPLRTVLAVVACWAPDVRERAVVNGSSLPAEGAPPPPLDELARDLGIA
jgi:hypothetical protein